LALKIPEGGLKRAEDLPKRPKVGNNGGFLEALRGGGQKRNSNSLLGKNGEFRGFRRMGRKKATLNFNPPKTGFSKKGGCYLED